MRAHGAVVRLALHAARAGAAPVHEARDALRPRDRSSAGGALSRHPQPAHDGRARRAVPRCNRGPATSARSSTSRRTACRAGSRARTGSPRRSKCCASRRSAATRTGRSRPACCCSAPRRIPAAPGSPRPVGGHHYSQALTGVKSFFRLVDGLSTLFLVARDGTLLDIVDVNDWAKRVAGSQGADRALPGRLPRARARHAPGRARVSRAQPVARDQGVRGRGTGAGVPARHVGAARSAEEVPSCGRRRSATRRSPVPVQSRRSSSPTPAKGRCSWCCAIRLTRSRRSWPRPDRLDTGAETGARRGTDTARPALPARRPDRHRARADRARGARVARRRDGDRPRGTPASRSARSCDTPTRPRWGSTPSSKAPARPPR